MISVGIENIGLPPHRIDHAEPAPPPGTGQGA